MSVPIGITVPKLLPITGTFAPAFAVYYILLCGRVAAARENASEFLGETSNSTTPGQIDPLQVAIRSQQNFAEFVPLALLFGSMVELNGGNRKALTAGFGVLLVSRIIHVEFGLKGKDAHGPGRLYGFLGTIGFIGGMAGYAGWLVKTYWGL